MTRHAVRWSLTGAALELLACSTTSSALNDAATATALPDSHDAAQSIEARDAGNGGKAISADAGTDAGPADEGCGIKRVSRTYVGFSAGMDLEDFELAAYQADRLLAMLGAALCHDAARLDPTGTLAAKLEARRLEVFELLFVADDASAADVGLRVIGGLDAGAPSGYRVAAELQGDRWYVSSVAAQ